MEKRLCLTSFWVVLPVCGAGGLCLLFIFARFSPLSWLPYFKWMASFFAKG
jgi:hypothetical protein